MTIQDEMFSSNLINRIDEYSNVPKIIMGINAIDNLSSLAMELAKNMSVLLVTDKNLEKIGSSIQLKESLQNTGFAVDTYSAKVSEPGIEEAHQITTTARKGNYGLFIGLGGGSIMDLTKIAAVMADTPGELEDYLCPSEKQLGKSKPKIMIPTTSGTGSECSNFAVVIAKDERIGPIKTWIAGEAVLADSAIVDPALTISLPPRETARCGMDALSHVAEAVLSMKSNPISDALALKAIELIFHNLKKAWQQGTDINARWQMSLAATIGGIVITYPWIAGPALIGHVASEGISALYGVSHGETCGVLLPYVFWYNSPHQYAREKLIKIVEVMGTEVAKCDQKDAVKHAITNTFDLLEEIDMPTSLKELGILEKDIPMLSEYILKRAEEMYSMSEYNPIKATKENIEEFFSKAMHGRDSIE